VIPELLLIFFNGSIWTPADGTFDQSNTSTTVNDNISTFNSSGTFTFKAFLSSTGTATPQLDNLILSGDINFSTEDNFFIDTTTSSQVNPSTPTAWTSLTISRSVPASSTGTILFSVDDRINWQTFNGTDWVVVIDSVTRTNGTGFGVAESNIVSLSTGLGILDARVFLKTDNSTVTLSVSNINITNDSGVAIEGNFETNEFDSGEIDILWQNLLVSSTTPPGTSIIYKGKAANTSTEIALTTFTAITPGRFTNLEGQIIQLKIEMIGVSTATPTLDKIGVRYQTPRVPSIQTP